MHNALKKNNSIHDLLISKKRLTGGKHYYWSCCKMISEVFKYSSIYSIALGPRPLQAYTHSVNLTNTFRYTYTWKQRIGMAGRIVNLTPHKSFNALALVFNGHWNITLLTTKHLLIYYPIHELFSEQNRYANFARFLVTFLLLHFIRSRHLIMEGRYQ